MTDPKDTASASLRAAAGALSTAGALVRGEYAWIPTAAAALVTLAADLVADGYSPQGLAHGLRPAVDALPGVSSRQARDIADGVGAVVDVVRGWCS